MTVASTTNRVTFTGDSVTTSFATTPVAFYATSDLKVHVTTTATGVSTLLVEGTGYTVSGGDAATGAVGTVSLAGGSAPHGALLTGTKLTVLLDLPLLQGADFVQNDATNAEVAEAALDKQVRIAQRLDDRLDRSLVVADGDVSGADFTVPVPVASTIIGWNSAGLALQNYLAADIAPDVLVSTFMKTVVDDVDAATARATIAAAKSGVATASDITLNTARLLGRTTTAAGAIEEISVAASLTLTGGSLAGAQATTAQAGVAVWATQAEADAGTASRVPTTDLNKITLGTPQVTTSGTAFDFTGLPAGVRRITISFNEISLSGTDHFLVQIGPVAGIEATSYIATSGLAVNAGTGLTVSSTVGFPIYSASATVPISGHVVLTLHDSSTNLWIASQSLKRDTTTTVSGGGSKSIAGVLTQVRLTRTGTDTFDAGSVSITYER